MWSSIIFYVEDRSTLDVFVILSAFEMPFSRGTETIERCMGGDHGGKIAQALGQVDPEGALTTETLHRTA
jgi:hypothetical protein